jgi:flavin reductase (DIM6/NTAB) family NADH-FMN oxidoreductase RutF
VPVDPDDLRTCMGCRASAVSIVTASSGDRHHGMTVSDFTSVSLEPPLVLVSASKDARTLEVIDDGKCFAINILAADQQELSNLFASKEREDVRFEGLDFEQGATGSPLIPGAIANIDCRLVATHEAGDHILCIGQVEEIRLHEAAPLVYFRGGYRELVDS